MGNDNHDPKNGQFTSSGAGAAVGDHQRSQSKPVGPGRQPVLSAKAETIAKFKRVDESHYPTRSDADVRMGTDLARPQGSITATPGRFSVPPGELDPKRNDHVNAIMRASGSPSVNRPTAGQLVAAKIVTPQ